MSACLCVCGSVILWTSIRYIQKLLLLVLNAIEKGMEDRIGLAGWLDWLDESRSRNVYEEA